MFPFDVVCSCGLLLILCRAQLIFNSCKLLEKEKINLFSGHERKTKGKTQKKSHNAVFKEALTISVHTPKGVILSQKTLSEKPLYIITS